MKNKHRMGMTMIDTNEPLNYRPLLLGDIQDTFIKEELIKCKNNYLLEDCDAITILEIVLRNWNNELVMVRHYTYVELLGYYATRYPPHYCTEYISKLNGYMGRAL